MMHSVENRFIMIVCGTILIVVAPLLILLLTLSSARVARDHLETAQVLMDASAQALGKPLWDFDSDSVGQIAQSMLGDDEIIAVGVRDSSGAISVQLPAGNIDTTSTPHTTLSKPIQYHSLDGVRAIGTIEVRVATPGVFSRFGMDELSVLAILVFAVGIVFASAIVGNRITVIRPLMRLTAAIEATRRLGSRHHVDWTSNDEMGNLAQNFNEMQDRLEREENELKIAHRRATEIYNLTPAMLFSLDTDNRLTAVSDYWLVATGYHRDQVIGRPFTDFVDVHWHETYRARQANVNATHASICEVTVPFVKADGDMMTVLILEMQSALEDKGGLSLSVMTDVTALKQAESRNHAQAITDHLTGLLNRQGFEAALDENIRHADDQQAELACIFIDLDRFKWINDNFGHAAGDEVLRQVVKRIKTALRPGDTLSRLGGDEFAILLTALDVKALASEIGERICAGLREPILVEGAELSVSSSVGIALYPTHAANAADLLLKSDMAMYARKRDGKNGMQLFDASMLDTARERHEIEQYIENGLKEDWFEAYLQPIVSLSDGRIAGFEALMRLNHPEKGILPPAKIIGVAEETGMIGRVGERVMEKAIVNLARISRLDGTQETYLAVNFSPLQFEETLPHRLAALLLKHHVSPSRIVVEITEAVLMIDNPHIHAVLKQLSEFGCRIALDDFGTGYSSLSYLNRFPVDIVKVDQSFTRSLSTGTADVRRKSRMLIKGIRTISHQMGCTVVAEGIETQEQWELLRKLGLDYGQGYLFSKPMPIESMLQMLETKSEVKTGHLA